MPRDDETLTYNASHDGPLTPIERALVAALVSAIVKEIRASGRSAIQPPAVCA